MLEPRGPWLAKPIASVLRIQDSGYEQHDFRTVNCRNRTVNCRNRVLPTVAELRMRMGKVNCFGEWVHTFEALH